MRFLKSFIPAFLISGFVSFMLVGTVYSRIEGTQLNKDAFILDTKPTVVYDANNKVMAKFYKDIRNTAMFDEIPVEIINGVISTEDRDFFKHAGISVKAISRAAIEIIKANGELVQGGSTITQQLIKNTHLTSAKSLERKQQEAIYSTLLEQQYTKREILEMYLNDNEYSNLAIGIKDATMTYFGVTFEEFNKMPKEERIIKGALLAGISQSPTRLNPYKNPEGAKARRDEVIKNMRETGTITEEEYQNTIGKDLMILETPNTYFKEQRFDRQELVHYALQESADKLGISIQEVMKSGYDIHTTFDPNVYDIIREEFKNEDLFPTSTDKESTVEAAAVYLNPKNGEIIAFTGGRDDDLEFLGFNRAFMLQKQPGSAFKPIIAFGPALETGKFTPYSLLLDEKGHVFPGGYSPKNWDNGGRGRVTMKEALRQSWNIPAVWTLQQVGLKDALAYANKLGLDLKDENSLGIALGGLTHGISPLELADSYQVFANKGIRTPAHAVKYIEANKKTIYEIKTSTQPTIDPQNATDMKDMLRNSVAAGTSSSARIEGRKIAGKTGTVEHPLIQGKPNSDIWFVGFDEEILGTIWMGYDQTSTKRWLNVGSSFSGKTWSKITKKILDYQSSKGNLSKPEELDVSRPPDDEPPTITLVGDSTVVVNLNADYKELGATAKDNADGDLSSKIIIDGAVDSTTEGNYTVTYSVSDSAGNETVVTRTIVVKKPDPKIYSLSTNADDSNGVIDLSWTSADNNTSFRLYRDGQLIHEGTASKFADKNVERGKYYEYYVVVVNTKDGAVLAETKKQTVSLKVAETPVPPTGDNQPPIQPPVHETPSDGIDNDGSIPNQNEQPPNQNSGTDVVPNQ